MNPGIVKTVRWLNDNGFVTTDSGDGETHDCECDRDHAYVVIRCAPEDMVVEADRLLTLLQFAGVSVDPIDFDQERPCIQADYDPANRMATISLMGVSDKVLFQ